MCTFLKEDVFTVARAVLTDPLETMSGDFVTYIFCNYCDAELHGYQYRFEDFKHDVRCPVLIAQDIPIGV